MSFLIVDHVSKFFPGHAGGSEVCIFKDVTVKVDKGEFVTVIGHRRCCFPSLFLSARQARPANTRF